VPGKKVECWEPLSDDTKGIKPSGNWKKVFIVLAIGLTLANILLIVLNMVGFFFFRENLWVVWISVIAVVAMIIYALRELVWKNL